MKKLLLLCLFISHSVFAQNCPSDPVDTMELISNQKTCFEAAQIAERCAWGSRVDQGIAGSAIKVCTKNSKNWSQKHQLMHSTLQTDCEFAYGDMAYSENAAMAAFCALDVSKLFNELYSQQ